MQRRHRNHVLYGGAIVFASLIAFFTWGIHFDLFGHDIDFRGHPGPTAGFFLWVLLGAFGAGTMMGGPIAGLKWVGAFAGLFGGAFLLGWLLGNYS